MYKIFTREHSRHRQTLKLNLSVLLIQLHGTQGGLKVRKKLFYVLDVTVLFQNSENPKTTQKELKLTEKASF